MILGVGYLFDGYPTEHIATVTDEDNVPAQRMLEGLGFQKEGILRRVMFRDGQWRDAVFIPFCGLSGTIEPRQKRKRNHNKKGWVVFPWKPAKFKQEAYKNCAFDLIIRLKIRFWRNHVEFEYKSSGLFSPTPDCRCRCLP